MLDNSPGAGTKVATDFLQIDRRDGPWLPIAIDPEKPKNSRGAIRARLCRQIEDAADFIRNNNGICNLYYPLNRVREGVTQKPTKLDIEVIEYLHADLDPRKGESPAAAKARYLANLNRYPRWPSAIIDSGNGIQARWRLDQPIPLEVEVVGGKRQFTPGSLERSKDAEERSKAIMLALDSVAGTQNIDRILRLPGTVNIPDATKLRDGRVKCPTHLIESNDTTHPLEAFPRPEPSRRQKRAAAGGQPPGGATNDDDDKLWRVIRDGCFELWDGDRSKAVWYVTNEMLRRGYGDSIIERELLDRRNKVSEHIHAQSNPESYARDQIKSARTSLDLARDDHGRPYKTQANIRTALVKLGVTLRYDEFADQTLVGGLPGFGPVLDDAAVRRIWLLMDQRFRLSVSIELTYAVVEDTARLNAFHPVRDYLGALQWDGRPRLDTWLTDCAGAEDTKYVRAVGALVLMAAVRRVRQPGCKFDEMLVLENPTQGTAKSSALATLAIKEDWFTDDLPLNAEGKRVIESLRGRWIVEAGELSGMKRSDVEHLKAMLSRQIDRARMAFGRLVSSVPRQNIIIGTTNDTEYLRDATGNRRFWPVLVGTFDLDRLRRDRDQLWAEAAEREATGASIRLAEELWPAAEVEQGQRLTADPWVAILSDLGLGRIDRGKISTTALFRLLDIKPTYQTQDLAKRLSTVMWKLGWRRPNTGGTIKEEGRLVAGYVCGDSPWRTVVAVFDKEAHEFTVKYKEEADAERQVQIDLADRRI